MARSAGADTDAEISVGAGAAVGVVVGAELRLWAKILKLVDCFQLVDRPAKRLFARARYGLVLALDFVSDMIALVVTLGNRDWKCGRTTCTICSTITCRPLFLLIIQNLGRTDCSVLKYILNQK